MNTTNPLERAASTLRQHTDRGWMAIRADVFSHALAMFRPSAPVRGVHGAGEFFLAADVLVAHLRDALDAIPRAGVSRITCTTDADHNIEAVTVEIIALYRAQLVPLAETIRHRAAELLVQVLGLPPEQLRDVPVHVGVTDVTNDAALL
ncbi:hypothetical protein [Georgenia yuyongxinii]|uniref:Uncharacterized protein n=1 Tax=Georgenia yuyongxinii TaxID=2589797 RepID=A0A552WMZ1_9MICO|nr:hypothetical protein [Georgenia yuyongxinii]TRW44110.1 hypothetical protein FJ693_14900 [Georgenia yuyongxinii]